jgi:hypothetical protein
VTLTSLLTALGVGVLIGLGGRLLLPARRGVPFWVPLAVGVTASLLGTVTARLAGVVDPAVSDVELLLQGLFAGAAVALVAATADRRSGESGQHRTGRPR